jgi:quercetin dioxygenase-like cupin family protein
MTARTPIIRASGEGDRRWFYGGGTHTWKIKAEETDGAFFVMEDTLEQGKLTPLHRHPDVDEVVYVIEGEILVNIDGQEHHVSQGGVTMTPRGVPHAFLVTSESARVLTFQSPGSAQRFYWNASEPAANDGSGPTDFDRVREVAEQHVGTDLLGPPPFAVPA